MNGIAFATIIGTVGGFIIASSGAAVHALVSNCFGALVTDKGRVVIGKLAAVAVGIISIPLSFIVLIVVSLLTRKKEAPVS